MTEKARTQLAPVNLPALRRPRELAPLALLLLLAGLFAYSLATAARRPAFPPPAPNLISAQMLEEQYGIHINLLAVTAANGMVDLRFKVLDAGKAGRLITSSDSAPALFAEANGTLLKAPEEAAKRVNFESGQVYFIQFPNTHNAIRPGELVTVVFGDVRLEPVRSK